MSFPSLTGTYCCLTHTQYFHGHASPTFCSLVVDVTPIVRYPFDKIVATNVVLIFKMSEQLLNIKFVAEVKKYPCLYNYSLKEYSKKDVTEKAWETVGKVVNLTG